MKRLAVTIVGIAACAAALAQPAAAATEVGNRCSATTSTSGATLVSLANAPGNPPAAIPTAGVITSWRFSIAVPLPPELALSETLKVFRPAGAKQVQVVAESAPQFITGASQAFATRIPVQPGDQIGALASAGGSTGTVFCETGNPGDVGGFVLGTASVGSTLPIVLEEPGVSNPIIAAVEADADADGFGDETQDQCPQSALTQAPCPTVNLSTSATATKKLVTVLVTASSPANVTVNAVAALGKGKKAKIKGGTKAVAPGGFTKFKLKLPAKVRERLKELPPSRKLTLKVTSSATNLAAAPTQKILKVKLKGQG